MTGLLRGALCSSGIALAIAVTVFLAGDAFGSSATAPRLLSDANIQLTGGAAGDNAGLRVAGAGDVNGDGVPDLLIGAPHASASSGAVYVVFAQPGLTTVDLGSLGSHGYEIEGVAGADAGWSVANAGDVNGDGIPDAVLGALGEFPGGAVYVVFGKATTTAVDLASLGTRGFRISDGRTCGCGTGIPIGDAVAGAGDVNGDGKADVEIGAPQASAAFVVFGKADASAVDLTSLGAGGYRVNGATPNGQAGKAVSSAGDVNGDGLADVLVSEPDLGPGKVYVVYGKADGATIDLASLGAGGYQIDGPPYRPPIGNAVADAGDVNGDGVPDQLIGDAPDDKTYVVFGQSKSTSTIELSDSGTYGYAILFADQSSGFGSSVASLGDLNGDGIPDTVIGAESSTNTSGSAYVVYLHADTSAISIAGLDAHGGGYRLDGAPHDAAGYTVADAGDVNGDGVDDPVVGAPLANPSSGNGAGRVYVDFFRPPNDDFAAAQQLTVDQGSVNGTTIGATKQPSEPDHAGNRGGASVWYQWTASSPGTLKLDTCNSRFNTLLAVYSGTDVGHLNGLASDDDGPATCGLNGLGSQVSLRVSVGTTYDIAVDGHSGDRGRFALAWTRTNAPPASCLVPKLKGKSLIAARTLLHQAHCALGRVSYTHSHLRRGLIVSQRPSPGASRASGTKVSVVVSRGPAR